MHRKVLILLVAGVLLSALSGAGIYFYIGALEAQLGASREKLRQVQADLGAISDVVEVPVLKADVAPGGEITLAGLETARVSLAHMPSDILRNTADLLGKDKTPQTLVAATGLTKGQVLLRSQLLLPDAQRGGTILVPLGQQAFALQAANLAEYRDSLKPGASVDVFWRLVDRKGNRTTRFLVAGMKVARTAPGQGAAAAPRLAVESRPETLFVGGTPDQVALLVQTEGRGELFVAPGGTDGTLPQRVAGVDNQTLDKLPMAKEPPASELSAGIGRLSSAEPAQPAPTPVGLTDNALSGLLSTETTPSKCFMTVVKGANRSVIEVPCR